MEIRTADEEGSFFADYKGETRVSRLKKNKKDIMGVCVGEKERERERERERRYWQLCGAPLHLLCGIAFARGGWRFLGSACNRVGLACFLLHLPHSFVR